jgi:hypothetical protein
MAFRYADPDELIETAAGHLRVGEIQSRIRVLEPGIILMHELEQSNAQTYGVFMATAVELAKPFERFALVNDIRDVGNPPRGDYYDAIIKAATTLGVHWAIVMPGGPVVRTMVRFIMARLLREGTRAGITRSLHDSVEAGVAAARQALEKAGGP